MKKASIPSPILTHVNCKPNICSAICGYNRTQTTIRRKCKVKNLFKYLSYLFPRMVDIEGNGPQKKLLQLKLFIHNVRGTTDVTTLRYTRPNVTCDTRRNLRSCTSCHCLLNITQLHANLIPSHTTKLIFRNVRHSTIPTL